MEWVRCGTHSLSLLLEIDLAFVILNISERFPSNSEKDKPLLHNEQRMENWPYGLLSLGLEADQ